MEDITLSIFPVGKALLVIAGAKDWFLFINVLLKWLSGWLHFVALVELFIYGSAFHSVRINDFCFFLKVECLLGFHKQGTLSCLLEVFLVTTEKGLWIWISYKLICASGSSLSFVACVHGVRLDHSWIVTTWLWPLQIVSAIWIRNKKVMERRSNLPFMMSFKRSGGFDVGKLVTKVDLAPIPSVINRVAVPIIMTFLWSFKIIFILDLDQTIAWLRIFASSKSLLVHACIWILLIIINVLVVYSFGISVGCNWSHFYLALKHFRHYREN